MLLFVSKSKHRLSPVPLLVVKKGVTVAAQGPVPGLAVAASVLHPRQPGVGEQP